MEGTYIGYSTSKKYVNYNYRINLFKNGTFSFLKSADLYNHIGEGSWSLIKDSIIIKFNNEKNDSILDVFMPRRIINITDTIIIRNKNSLSLRRIILKRTPIEKK